VAYFPTYHHFAPFGIGILVGYFLLKFCEDSESWSIPSKARFIFWLLLPLSSLSILILAHFWNVAQEAGELNKIIKTLFAAFQRPIWCLGIAWITLCCGTGKGGVFNDLLSWRGFVPLSRLSFCIYTVHLVPIYIRAYSIKYTTSWDDYYFVSIQKFAW
jgi:PREDICTED: similar to CG5892 CG5892-PA